MATNCLSLNCSNHLHTAHLPCSRPAPIILCSQPPPSGDHLPNTLLRFSASAILFLGLTLRAPFPASARLPPPPVADSLSIWKQPVTHDVFDDKQNEEVEQFEDEKLGGAFENYKSKQYALSVPLRVVALRGSVPPSWVKDFMRTQGKRLKFNTMFRGSLEEIFSDFSMPFRKGNIGPKSTVAVDIVTIGDSWLHFAISKGVIEPINGVEDQDWYKDLNKKWKIYLCRNSSGEIDPEGKMWAVPYRWGSMVIAYKESQFQKHKLAPIEDWSDLWRPELAGRISMVNSPREVIGAVLKFMGASYNVQNMDLQVTGGRDAVQNNLALLRKQVRLFDSHCYLKAFNVGDVWVAVGWSSDVLPVAKRMSNVAVIVPKSGASLWADLWAIPAASRLEANQIGSRTRGPSPLIHQWIEFCLQAARALPFIQEVIPGASPSALACCPLESPKELANHRARLDTNLIAGAPPPEILARCEFLDPLTDAALSDYKSLIGTMPNPALGLIKRIQSLCSIVFQTFLLKLHLKVTSA